MHKNLSVPVDLNTAFKKKVAVMLICRVRENRNTNIPTGLNAKKTYERRRPSRRLLSRGHRRNRPSCVKRGRSSWRCEAVEMVFGKADRIQLHFQHVKFDQHAGFAPAPLILKGGEKPHLGYDKAELRYFLPCAINAGNDKFALQTRSCIYVNFCAKS